MTRQKDELLLEKDHYKQQMELNSQMLTKKNNELTDNIQQIESLKKKYEATIREYEGRTTKLISQMSNSQIQ